MWSLVGYLGVPQYNEPFTAAGFGKAMELPAADGFDAVVFAVPHVEYVAMDVPAWLGAARPLVVDANDVLPADRLRELALAGCRVWSIGRGEISA